MHEALRPLNQQAQETMDGSPSVARDAAGYINLKFQCGPIQEHGVNGTGIENVIELLITRLQGFQGGPFACNENAAAIYGLGVAIAALETRTARRLAQGVEGTNAPHHEPAPISGHFTLTNGERHDVRPNPPRPVPGETREHVSRVLPGDKSFR